MKQILTLILIISFLSSCKDKKQNNNQSKIDLKTESIETEIRQKQNPTQNYWELILDTITNEKEFKILNKEYKLELKTFSLNDSLIVRNLGQGDKQVYLDHSHTIVSVLKLLTDSNTDQKRIDRTDFEKALISEFYAECNLFSTEIDSIKGNVVYLNSSLVIPDTDNVWKVWYSIKIKNNKLGKLDIKETDYIGL